MREDTKKQVRHECGWYAWVLEPDKERTLAEHVAICGTDADELHSPAARLFDV
jgi:hypothetical protein